MKVKNAIKKAVGLSTVTMMLSANILFTGNFLVEELISYAQENENEIVVNNEQQENFENITLNATQDLIANYTIEEEKVSIIQTKISVNLEGNIYKPQMMQIELNENIVPNTAPSKILVRSLKNTNYFFLTLEQEEGTKIIVSNNSKEEAVAGTEEFLITYVYNYINETESVNTENLDIKINKIDVLLQGENLIKTIEDQTTTLETTQVQGEGINVISSMESFGIGRLSVGQTQNFEETIEIQGEPQALTNAQIIIEDLGNTIYSNNGTENTETEIKPIMLKTVIGQMELEKYLGQGYKIELIKETIQEGTEETIETVIAEYVQPLAEPQTEVIEIEESEIAEESTEVIEEQKIITEEEENIVITYPENTSNFKIKLTQGTIEEGDMLTGKLELKTTKQIMEQQKEAVENLSTIFTNVILILENSSTAVALSSMNGIEIDETENKASIEILNPENGQDIFPAGESVANVSITLKTDSSTSQLYTDPVIVLHQIEGVEINKITNLSIRNNGTTEQPIFTAQVQEIEGKNVINLTGSQTQYNSELENVTISFEMVMKTEKEIININDQPVIATITNNNGGVISSLNVQDTINIQAEEKLFINHNITATENIAVGENNITIGKINENQTITIENTLKNNTPETKENVIIYGKMPLMEQGATILEPTAQNAKIYFTTNAEATQDITNAENGWLELTNIADQSQIKQYLIVINQLETAQTEKITITLNIPASIPENQKSTYTRNVAINGVAQGEVQTIECYTPSKVDISATILADKETYFQGEEITYTIKITNNNTIKSATGITIESILPANLETVGETNWANINILPGETIEKTIKMKIPANAEIGEVTAEINVTANGLETPINLSKTVEIKVEPVKIETEYFVGTENVRDESNILNTGDMVNYFIKIYNKSEEADIENLKISYTSYDLQLGSLTFKEKFNQDDIIVECSPDATSAKLQGKIHAGNHCIIKFLSMVKDNYNKKELIADVKIEYDQNGKHVIKEIKEVFPTETMAQIQANLSLIKEKKELQPGEEVEFILTVKNEGETGTYIYIYEQISENLKINKIIEEKDNNSTEMIPSSDFFGFSTNINGGETINYYFYCTSKNTQGNTEIENYATVNGSDIGEITTNKITNTIKGTLTEENPSGGGTGSQTPEPENPQQTEFTISGQAWIDRDKNGTKDKKDANMKGIVVKIINVETGEYVKTASGEQLTQITGNKGEYAFSGLKAGKYIIEFEYNTNTYYLIPPTQEIQISNITTQQGIKTRSEIINIQNSDINDVNIALALRDERFDLALNKYVTKVTVTNQKGTTTYENLKTNLAKIEIDRKYMVGSKVAVEYTIELTNQGSVAGKANKIVDYIPEGMEFNSELNTEWYQDNDGNLYCTSLAENEIAPGETKTIKLILTRTIGSTSKLDIKNTAEIQEHYNKELLNDKDSIPANKNSEEDDQSTAELIVSISTGGEVYTILIITCSIIVLAGTIVIKKYVV